MTSSLLIPNYLPLRLRLVNKTVENTSLKTNAETVAIVAARAADDKQGSNILVLNVGDVLAITEMFVVVSASNSRQLRTIANEVTAKIREESDRPLLRSEGMAEQ